MADGAQLHGVERSGKFSHPTLTADGAVRAQVPFAGLKTLWINTGTLCNLACAHCYIESSPTNDRLVYITDAEAAPFIDEALTTGADEVAFTGGEPFMNPDLFAMAERALAGGARVLILTNAMRPMMRPRIKERVAAMIARHGARVALRVSLDHHAAEIHDAERGRNGAFDAAMKGLAWLCGQGAVVSVAGRAAMAGDEEAARRSYQEVFDAHGVAVDAGDPAALVLFPEMDAAADPPEVTVDCWRILDRKPEEMMCASSRMLVKRRGSARPAVLACTLIPYAEEFELGASLRDAAQPVTLNHPNCATFCVLGGSSCSG